MTEYSHSMVVAPIASKIPGCVGYAKLFQCFLRTVNRGDGGSFSHVAVSKLRHVVHPTFACVFRFGGDTKSFLSGVYPREVKDSTQGVNM